MESAESTTRYLIRRAAAAYTAGPTVHHAQIVCERLVHQQLSTTVCYWNLPSDQPRYVAALYNQLLGLASLLQNDCYLSIKATALAFDADLLKTILGRAKSMGAAVHFDSMAPETVDRTFSLIEQARQSYRKLGCTLPGRWRRSLLDADRAVGMGLNVRVVKGQWAEEAGDEIDHRDGYLNVIDRLAAERAQHVAVATHNVELAREALRRLKTCGIPCELELLYGLPRKRMLQLARELDVSARMYVPCGQAGLPYHLRQAARNPRIIGWFLHDLVRAKNFRGGEIGVRPRLYKPGV